MFLFNLLTEVNSKLGEETEDRDVEASKYRRVDRKTQKLTQLSPRSRGKKDSINRRHHRHHQRQPGEQIFPIQVVTG